MRTLVVLCAVLPSTAMARSVALEDTELDVVGWSKDSATFAFSTCVEAACGGRIWDARTGRIRELEADRFETWVDNAGLSLAEPPKPSRTSGDGKGRAQVRAVDQKGGGTWKGATWTPASADLLSLAVERDGKSWTVASLSVLAIGVDAYWSPDGRRVAWVVTSRYWPQVGEGSYQVLVTAAGPRVQVLADKAILAKAGPLTAKALEEAGLAPTFVGRANEARAASVIYFATGFEEEAKKAAAAVPGGAKVEKLSWKADADLVVAAGVSALGGQP